MDILTTALCLSIGNIVAWLFALYSARGPYWLIWDTAFGIAGTALCGAGIAYFAPILGVVGLVTAGPVCAAIAIVGSHAIRRALPRAFAANSPPKP